MSAHYFLSSRLPNLFCIALVATHAMIIGPAVAADMPAKAPPPPVAPLAVYDWSGVYVGGSIGGVWGSADRFYPNLGLIGQSPATYTSSGSDMILGLHGGAQWQWGQWVLGIEAGVNQNFIDSQVLLPTFFAPDFYAHNTVGDLFTIGPRLGFAWDRWMAFVTGGYARGSIKGRYSNGAGNFIVSSIWGISTNDGWFIGGGVEYVVYRGSFADIVVGAEYQHFDLGETSAFCFLPGCTPHQLDFSQSAQGELVRARLSIKTHGFGFFR